MANRHLSRSIVTQSLFEWDFNKRTTDEAMEIFARNAKEFALGMGDFSFMESLIKGILEKQKDIDVVIEKAAPDWPLDKISMIDRNILRLGLYELLFADRSQVPPKVAINEAIELAKSFGGDTSGRFVNGVLGAVYKEMGEPGKDEKSKHKRFADVPDDQAPVERLGGAIVYAKTDDGIKLALVHDVFGHWTLSKGHLEEGEDDMVGIARVVKDELGIDISVETEVGSNGYIAYDPEKGKIKKVVKYFLAGADFQDLTMKEGGGLTKVQWFSLAEILDLNFYNDILPIVTKAIETLSATD